MVAYELERKAACEAARLASRLCLAVRSEMLHKENHMEKAGHEPVTIADYGAQALILQHIAQHFPDDGTLAEEGAGDFDRLGTGEQHEQVIRHVGQVLGRDIDLDSIREWLDFGKGHTVSRMWLVDPIDGTKGFVRGDQFAIAIALVVDGEPVVGVVGCPLMPFGASGAADGRGVIASAVRGQGAVIEPLGEGPTRPAIVSDRKQASAARTVESVETGHTDHSWSTQVVRAANIGGQPVRIDSQAKYVAVADGRAEIYLRGSKDGIYRERVWDHAAGMLVVEEAGGRVTDLSGRPLDFSRGARLENNTGIVATNGTLHDTLLTAIQSIKEDSGR